jgi:hypothetical protein
MEEGTCFRTTNCLAEAPVVVVVDIWGIKRRREAIWGREQVIRTVRQLCSRASNSSRAFFSSTSFKGEHAFMMSPKGRQLGCVQEDTLMIGWRFCCFADCLDPGS